ncbi:PQQ-binding-like beta-propeller repeat protein [Streptomyces sp. Q6]|uniref:PQQ-binding-like beta-propeller repeat protein n=1 Tax=Streptomyces citrinus TaxID=3118173 RepID=A0ACD5AJU9_9ACTN
MPSPWRRHSDAPLSHPQAVIETALPLRGLGRVPQVIEGDLSLLTYVDATKSYDYRRVRADGTVLWHQAYPSGGYASAAYNSGTNSLCGPSGYFGYVEIDWETGDLIRRYYLERRVRATPVPVDSGFMATAGNRIYRLSQDSGVRHGEQERHVFFGHAVTHDGLFITAGVERDGTDTFTIVAAFDTNTLEQVWHTRLAEAVMPSCDTSGLVLHGGTVYINLPGPMSAAVDARTGSLVWRSELPTDASRPSIVCRSRPTIETVTDSSPNLLVTSLQGEVFSLDALSGALNWTSVPDVSAGIWSPAIAIGDDIVVHSGVFLFGLAPRTGESRWCTPVGFDAYTMPVEVDGRIVLCGGDPPNDGYLAVINPSCKTPPPQVTTAYQQGESRDVLSIVFSPSASSQKIDVTVDLRMFGRSAHEKLHPDLTGRLEWRGDVLPTKRLGESVVYATVHTAGQDTILPIYIDAGARTHPSEPSALAMDTDEMPGTQERRTDSGGLVVSAVARRHGHDLDPDEIENAAAWMRDEGISPHFIWRSGAERILMASQLPLPESQGRSIDTQEIERVLSAWEKDQVSN